MDKIKTVKIKNPDGSVSEETYTISVDAKNVDMDNGKDLQDTIGIIDVDTDGNISEQLNNLNKKVYYFNTVADMKKANLKKGDCVYTLGYYEINDGGASLYKIVSTSNKYVETLNNNLKAELIIEEKINVLQFGINNNNNLDITKLKSVLLSGAKIIDFLNTTFNIQNDELIEIKNDITLLNGTFYISGNNNTTGKLIKVKDKIKCINIHIKKGIFIDITNGYSSTINNIDFEKSSACEDGIMIHANSGQSIDSSNYGIKSVSIMNCDFQNTIKIPIVIYDMPCNFLIQNCRVVGMQQVIASVASTNENPYTDLIRKKINVSILDNICKDSNITSLVSGQNYFTFIFVKGNKIIASGNQVENLSINAQYNLESNIIGTHGMYLLGHHVDFHDNIFKNIYNFGYTGDLDGMGLESCDIFPNIKGSRGEKNIHDNVFLLEEDWLIEKCTLYNKTLNSLVPPLVWSTTLHGDTLNINNNIINSYFGFFYRRDHYQDNIVNMTNNVFNIKNLRTGNFHGNFLFRITSQQGYKGEYNISNNEFNFENCPSYFSFLVGNNKQESIKAFICNNIINMDYTYTIPRFVYAARGEFTCQNNNFYIKNMLNENQGVRELIYINENSYINLSNYIYGKNIKGTLGYIPFPWYGHYHVISNMNMKQNTNLSFPLPTEGSGDDINYLFKLKNLTTNFETELKIKLSFNNNVAYLTYENSSGNIVTKSIASELTSTQLFNNGIYTNFSTSVSDTSRSIYLSASFVDGNKDQVEIDMISY